MNPDLYDYLRTQFHDIETAKIWIHKWYNEMEQCLPWEDECEFSLRAMTGHCSAALEGNVYNGFYLEQKYGSDLYMAAI